MKNPVSAKEKEKSRRNQRSHGEPNLIRHSLWLIILIVGTIIGISAHYHPLCALSAQSLTSSLFSQGQITREELDNGMIVLLKEKKDIPLASIFLCVRSGSAHEGKFKGSGITHFIEHMVFKGTAERASGEIFQEIESYGGDINAFTSYDYTGYKITVPSQFLYPSLEVLSDMMVNASFDNNELKKEREVVLKEIRMSYDDPQRFIYRKLWETAYLIHTYKYPILGEEELFKELNRDKVRKFYQNRYTPENMVLCIVGDIEKDDSLSFIKDIFKDFRRKPKADPSILPEPRQQQLRQVEEKFTAGLTYLAMGFHGVSIADEDLYALDVLSTILGEGESSRLYDLICRQKQMAYSISAINYTPAQPGLFIISSLLEENKREDVQGLILDQIELLKEKFISADELESAKNRIISDIIFYNQTLEAQARDLALNEMISGDYRFSEYYVNNIEGVQAQDVLRVAKQYLTKENLTIVALTPKEPGKGSVFQGPGRPLQIGIEQLSKEEITATEENGESVDNSQKITAKNEVKEKSLLTAKTNREIKKFVLDNGLTLIVKEDKDMPLVSIKAAFKGGLRVENEDTNGICNLVAKLLDKGTKTKDAEEIAHMIESKGAHISGYSGSNSFFISMDLLSRDLDKMFALFADLIINSVFPEHEIDLQKEKNLAKLKGIEDNIFESGKKLLKENLFQKHPYRMEIVGNQKSLQGLTRKNLIAFYEKYCVGKNMVLTVFGDVDSDTIVKKTEEYFAQLNSGDIVEAVLPAESGEKSVRNASKAMPKLQSLLLMGFPGATVYSEDRFALELICQMLSQSSGRLFKEIREKAGQAYTLGAYQVLGLDPAYITIYVATTKESIDTVKDGVIGQLTQLKEKPVSSEELEQTKRALISQRLANRQTNSECALESALDELYGLGFDFYQEYADRINALSAENVQKCANKYFDFDNYALVIIGPK
ncbi:MAG: insulinase family protein [Candidatus Omnitrophica bacterium]|nr:insulinase family protein [Candidatus Omnitrophota bacterium]